MYGEWNLEYSESQGMFHIAHMKDNPSKIYKVLKEFLSTELCLLFIKDMENKYPRINRGFERGFPKWDIIKDEFLKWEEENLPIENAQSASIELLNGWHLRVQIQKGEETEYIASKREITLLLSKLKNLYELSIFPIIGDFIYYSYFHKESESPAIITNRFFDIQDKEILLTIKL